MPVLPMRFGAVLASEDTVDAAHVAFLVRVDQEKEIEHVVKYLGEKWDGRVELRLLGPMAPYDFVGATEPWG
jgi:hypothetical protein